MPKQPIGDTIRVPREVLIELGYMQVAMTQAAHYLYGRGTCEHTVEVPINDSDTIWCPVCQWENLEPSQLKRIYVSPAQQQVWHEHWNWTTGRVESDRKGMEEELHRHSQTISEELGIAHEFERIDHSELIAAREAKGADRNGKEVGSGWQSQHDQAVKDGRKDSKGKYVWSMK